MAENESPHHHDVSEQWQKTSAGKLLPIGVAGALGMLAWGGYSFRYKGEMPTPLFMMHLRIKTQSMIVGALTFGVAYSLLKQYAFGPTSHFDEHGHLRHLSHDEERRRDRLIKK